MKRNESVLGKRLGRLIVAAAAAGSVQATAHNEGGLFASWSTAVPEVNINTAAAEGCPIETADGLSLFFASTRPGAVPENVGNDIWVTDRATLSSPWQPAKNLGAPINSKANDFCPTPAYGRWLFFVSERLDNGTPTPPCGGGDIYLARQSPADGAWGAPQMLKCAPQGPNFSGGERSPSLVETIFGTFLFYSSNGSGGDQDIYMSRLQANGSFGPGKVVKELSTEFEDIMPNVRARDDGLFEIVFSSNRPTWGNGQPAKGQQDVYISYAFWPTAGWSAPRNLGDSVNTGAIEQRATLSADGRRLHFGRTPDSSVPSDIYTSQRPAN
jgi:WD40-like Beta Propeller Repeat